MKCFFRTLFILFCVIKANTLTSASPTSRPIAVALMARCPLTHDYWEAGVNDEPEENSAPSIPDDEAAAESPLCEEMKRQDPAPSPAPSPALSSGSTTPDDEIGFVEEYLPYDIEPAPVMSQDFAADLECERADIAWRVRQQFDYLASGVPFQTARGHWETVCSAYQSSRAITEKLICEFATQATKAAPKALAVCTPEPSTAYEPAELDDDFYVTDEAVELSAPVVELADLAALTRSYAASRLESAAHWLSVLSRTIRADDVAVVDQGNQRR